MSLSRMIESVSIMAIEGDLGIMLNREIYVAIVHDSSGYTPQGVMFISSLNPNTALEEAFAELEDRQANRLSNEERREREEFQDKGYDSLTEGYDGKTFSLSASHFREILTQVKNKYTAEKIKKANIEFFQD